MTTGFGVEELNNDTNTSLDLHKGREKPHSAPLTQLRTGKMGFNQFLSERKVPGMTSTCGCGAWKMTVQHILLPCPRWSEERKELRRVARSTDLKAILGAQRDGGNSCDPCDVIFDQGQVIGMPAAEKKS